MHRGRQEALLRHLRGRGEEPGVPDFRADESSLQRSGDRLKQELINMAGKALVSTSDFLQPPHPNTSTRKAPQPCMHARNLGQDRKASSTGMCLMCYLSRLRAAAWAVMLPWDPSNRHGHAKRTC